MASKGSMPIRRIVVSSALQSLTILSKSSARESEATPGRVVSMADNATTLTPSSAWARPMSLTLSGDIATCDISIAL